MATQLALRLTKPKLPPLASPQSLLASARDQLTSALKAAGWEIETDYERVRITHKAEPHVINVTNPQFLQIANGLGRNLKEALKALFRATNYNRAH
jgi:hypothetical protein